MGPRLPISLGDHSLPAMIENFHQQLTATYLIRFICRLFLASAACKETAHLRPVCSNTRVSSRSEERVRGCGRILPPLDSSHADVRTVSIWRSFVFFSIEFAFFLFVLGSRSLTALDFDFGLLWVLGRATGNIICSVLWRDMASSGIMIRQRKVGYSCILSRIRFFFILVAKDWYPLRVGDRFRGWGLMRIIDVEARIWSES